MDWSDPTARFVLLEKVGVEEYTRRIRVAHDASIMAVINGHTIRKVKSARWGVLYQIENHRGFSTLELAEREALKLPAKNP